MADETLQAAGFGWYEVSNWARDDAARCRHNELYWSDANWWGVGPGAHSHVSGVRWWNVKHPARYTAMLEAGGSPAAGRENLDPRLVTWSGSCSASGCAGPAHRRADRRRPLGRPAAGRVGARRSSVGRRRTGRADPARPTDGRRGRARTAGLTLGAWPHMCGSAPKRTGQLVRRAPAQRVEVEDARVDACAVLQRRTQRPVQTVLEVHLAVPVHRVREQVAVEGRVLVEQPVQRQLASWSWSARRAGSCAARRWPSPGPTARGRGTAGPRGRP